jgi:malonate transporter and related proteins
VITTLQVILPVFLVIGFGWAAAWRGLMSEGAIDGLMKFAQNFALPCLLFRAIMTLDLQAEFSVALLGSFYAGAVCGFVAGILGGRFLFGRSWEDSVVIGFCCLFSNSLLLGLPITERAYGAGALAGNYAIVAIHAPVCYLIGIGTMEVIRNRGGGFGRTLLNIGKSLASNALVIGIVAGIAVNLSGLPMPGVVTDAVDLMVRAALPAALFGLGGVLFRYRPEGDLRAILFVCAVSLGLHPAIVWGLGTVTGLTVDQFRSAVLTAAMAPGVNAYLFANMYGRARRVAASSVLLATAGAILTTSVWLTILP